MKAINCRKLIQVKALLLLATSVFCGGAYGGKTTTTRRPATTPLVHRFAAISGACGPLAPVWGATALHVPYGQAGRFGKIAADCDEFSECVIFTCHSQRVVFGNPIVRCDFESKEWSVSPTCGVTTTSSTTTPKHDPCKDLSLDEKTFCWRPKLRWRFNTLRSTCEKFHTCSRSPDLGGREPNVFFNELECKLTCFHLTTTTTDDPVTPMMYPKTGGYRGPQCLRGVDVNTHSSCLNDSASLVATIPVDAYDVLRLHNTWRQNVTPPARFMPDLAWDFDLAITAERYAATCPTTVLGDSPSARSLPQWRDVGQNICHSMSKTKELTFDDCIDNIWGAESRFWRFGIGETRSNAVVSHYTQMIWAGSLFVGCGKAHCTNSTWTYVIVCNYAPNGNVAPSGENPTARPYIQL